MLIWASIVGTIYSNFLVFYSNFSESENYHKAYYNAISALERWELVIKQRKPWYKWNWGWILKTTTWTYNNWWSDGPINSSFSYISKSITDSSAPTTSIFRDINSRTNRIPSQWNWDVEWTLAADDSIDYNMMDYENAEVFLLYYDDSGWNPYNSNAANLQKRHPTNWTKIEWEIRLPKRLRWNWDSNKDFWPLDTNNPSVWWVGEIPSDDAVVDRQVRWKYQIGTDSYNSYTIYSTQSVASWVVKYYEDDAFRESDINNNLTFDFTKNNGWNPIVSVSRWWSSRLKVISQSESNIKTKNGFKSLRTSNTTENQIRFSILNLLKTNKDKIYPFLEYYIKFWSEVADKYYTIKAKWNYADYEVDMTIQKPTVKETILSSFTSIF